MEAIRSTKATLVDLLDRVLDKGLVINADIIISVAGIPLIGMNLRAALASMETMLKYGIMQAWDERIRAWERERRKGEGPTDGEDEMETCPQCGKTGARGQLLMKGCQGCGWVSPGLSKKLAKAIS